MQSLRKCFDDLDDDSSGYIGVSELEDPLIALGLVESRDQVQQLVDLVDDDGSNEVEFEEFLNIVKCRTNKKSSNSEKQAD